MKKINIAEEVNYIMSMRRGIPGVSKHSGTYAAASANPQFESRQRGTACVILLVRRMNPMDYSQCVQNTIAYIEQHLSNNLTLDLLAGKLGFSKYHFLCIFERKTGAGLWEYIQNRRMTKAAKLLMSTELPIMKIALLFRFDSQEAFTRAFKSAYALPPGKYRRAIHELIHNEENADMDMVDKNVPATDVDISSELPEAPVNLSFEESLS
jgi:AraC-like DNA-binding protein